MRPRFISFGNFAATRAPLFDFNLATISAGLSAGIALREMWTWSGITSSATISQLKSVATSSRAALTTSTVAGVSRMPLRYLGHQIKW